MALVVLRANLFSAMATFGENAEIETACSKVAAIADNAGEYTAAYVLQASREAAYVAVNPPIDIAGDAVTAVAIAFDAQAKALGGVVVASATNKSYEAFWSALRSDALNAHRGARHVLETPVWSGFGNALIGGWIQLRSRWAATNDAGWQFWTQWYDAALEGRPLLGDWDRHWALLTDIALIAPEVWDKGPDAVNPVVADIYDSYRSPTPLAQAAITDFTFDAAFRVMRAVGFEDDLIHLRDPVRVQAFLDDIEEARDGLTDFADYASEASGQTNAPRVLVRAAENLLDELKRTNDTAHLRARRLITLGRHLEGFANEETKRAELGETLADMLDENIAIVRDVCRQHLGPSLAALSALDGLELGDIDPRDLITRLDAAIRTIDSADGATLVPLAPGDVAMLRDMLDELRDLEASLGEARTDGFKERQRGKIARTAGQLGATLGRYTEKASKQAEDAGKALDGAVKWYRRWGSLSEALDWLKDTFGPGGPPM